MVILLLSFVMNGSALTQDNDAWLNEALKLKQQGWGERVSPVLPDQRRPIAPLMAFVSFSMPDDSLKAILNQVDMAGGTVVLRGLVNDSFKDTAATVAKLVEDSKRRGRERGSGPGQGNDNLPGFSVDPKLFTKYAITAVPTFVVTEGDRFDKIGGNMNLAAALQAVIREGDHSEAARRLLNKLRKGSP